MTQPEFTERDMRDHKEWIDNCAAMGRVTSLDPDCDLCRALVAAEIGSKPENWDRTVAMPPKQHSP